MIILGVAKIETKAERKNTRKAAIFTSPNPIQLIMDTKIPNPKSTYIELIVINTLF
jgi:hypothetical protein